MWKINGKKIIKDSQDEKQKSPRQLYKSEDIC